MEEKDLIEKVTSLFCLDSPIVSCEPYGNGVINKTYLAKSQNGKRYILQKLSQEAFKNIPALMENIRKVTDYLGEKNGENSPVILPVKTKNGGICIENEDGYYRMTPYAENTIAYDAVESLEDFYKTALGFGKFISALKDFPADSLVETIPNFHNTPDRYRIFHEALERDSAGRKKEVQKEIDFLLEREAEMGLLQRERESGKIPSRVTHNDTKLNNILFDADSKKPAYVIDLDTVMPGLSLYDYGDCVRFGAATAAEDEPDTEKMEINLDLYRVFTRGFLEACQGLTKREIELLPLGAKTITVELAMRFLTDYLNGDTYFAIKYPEHNLVRCRAQEKLALSMEKNWEAMQSILREECERAGSRL